MPVATRPTSPTTTPYKLNFSHQQKCSLLDTSSLIHPEESYLVKDLAKSSTSTRTSGLLYPGSRFKGIQKSGRVDYDVEIELKDINFDSSTICGYLTITGLTDEYPKLTTFFEGEMIGPQYHFKTGKWNADADIDWQHWSKFPSFTPCQPYFHTDRPLPAIAQPPDSSPRVLFMRWKEKFLVPDHRKRDINGASFAGFYYICYDMVTGKTEGYYFHESSELFQKLTLKHIADKAFGAFEFR